MKKRMFRVLCVVLALALLAPNVFAATPTPEVPLADEATVTRVKNEIATGQITDMEDVFLVAYQHLGADINEDGMTAYINPDGTLGFMQFIENNLDNSSISLCAINSATDEREIAVSTMAVLDTEANLLTDWDTQYNYWIRSDEDSLDTIYATHTAYFNARCSIDEDGNYGLADLEVQLNYMVTTIHHTSATYLASKLVQGYQMWPDGVYPEVIQSKTTNNPGSTSYTYTPNNRCWYNPLRPSGGLYTYSEIWIANTGNYFAIGSTLQFSNDSFFFSHAIP